MAVEIALASVEDMVTVSALAEVPLLGMFRVPVVPPALTVMS